MMQHYDYAVDIYAILTVSRIVYIRLLKQSRKWAEGKAASFLEANNI